MTDLPVELADAIKLNCTSPYVTVSPEIVAMSENKLIEMVFESIKRSSK